MINRFYRNVNRRKADEILATMEDKNFFIRHSSITGSYVLSIIMDHQIEHILIEENSKQFQFKRSLPTLLTTLRVFDSLNDIEKSLVEHDKAVPCGIKYVDHKLIAAFLNKYWSQEFEGWWGTSHTSPEYLFLKFPQSDVDFDISRVDIKKLLTPFYFKISPEFSLAFQNALIFKQIKAKNALNKTYGMVILNFNKTEVLEELMNLAQLKQVASLKALSLFKVNELYEANPDLDISILPEDLRTQVVAEEKQPDESEAMPKFKRG